MIRRLLPLTAALLISTAFLSACQDNGDTAGTAAQTTAALTTAVGTAEEATEDAATDTGNSDETQEVPDSVTITSLNASNETHELEVPYNPQRIAVLDMAVLDILDNLGVGAKVVGIADTSLSYLSEYSENETLVALGTIKEPHLENVMRSEPDVIFIGQRLAAFYDALSEIAPVVYLQIDHQQGILSSMSENSRAIASIFGLEDQVDETLTGYQARVDALSKFAENRDAAVVLVTSGGLNILTDDGRLSLIGNEIGFNNLGNTDAASTHGNEASFETIVNMDPEFMFVLDRDAAIGTEGAQYAKDVMENELIQQTRAFQENKIVYLEHPAVWYTAEGGLTAMDIMLKDLEGSLLD